MGRVLEFRRRLRAVPPLPKPSPERYRQPLTGAGYSLRVEREAVALVSAAGEHWFSPEQARELARELIVGARQSERLGPP